MNNIVKTALLLAVVLSVTAFAVGTLSEDSDAVSGGTYTGDGYTLAFTLENNEITITGFSADSDFDGSVVLDKFEGYSIVAIEDHVFQTT